MTAPAGKAPLRRRGRPGPGKANKEEATSLPSAYDTGGASSSSSEAEPPQPCEHALPTPDAHELEVESASLQDAEGRPPLPQRPSLFFPASEGILRENAQLRRDLPEVRHRLSNRIEKHKLELEFWQNSALRLELQLAESSCASQPSSVDQQSLEELVSCRDKRAQADIGLTGMQALLASAEQRLVCASNDAQQQREQRSHQASALLSRPKSSPAQTFAKSLSRLDNDTLRWVRLQIDEFGSVGSAAPAPVNGIVPAAAMSDLVGELRAHGLHGTSGRVAHMSDLVGELRAHGAEGDLLPLPQLQTGASASAQDLRQNAQLRQELSEVKQSLRSRADKRGQELEQLQSSSRELQAQLAQVAGAPVEAPEQREKLVTAAEEAASFRQRRLDMDGSLREAQAQLAVSEQRLASSLNASKQLREKRCHQAATLLQRGQSTAAQTFVRSLSRLDTETLKWVRSQIDELSTKHLSTPK